jgi:hypothetical protein
MAEGNFGRRVEEILSSGLMQRGYFNSGFISKIFADRVAIAPISLSRSGPSTIWSRGLITGSIAGKNPGG